MDEKTWVDFQVVKKAVSLQAVLDHYGVNWLRKSGDELRGRCPIHKGEGERTLSVNLAKNAFRCYSCRAKGNQLDFVAAMEDCSVRDAALKLQDWFRLGRTNGERKGERRAPATKRPASQRATEKPGGDELAPNAPLKFALKDVDPNHAYLAQRGIGKETLETFGVGFFPGKGLMAGRIVIPIHNGVGELVAYAGRAIDDSEPKYKFPPGFHKSLELYNLHRAVKTEDSGRVIVVEGFFDALNLHQAGYRGVVALMGCELSAAQERLLTESFYEIVLMLDGDEPGRAGAGQIAARLARSAWVRVVDVPAGKQPDQLSAHEIQMLLQEV
jgi:DNA primase